MQVLIFDSDPFRRRDWSRSLNSHPAQIQFFARVAELPAATIRSVRVIIFDHSVVEDCLQVGADLVAKLPQDVVAFSLPQCTVSAAVRLLRSGARWVFDNRIVDGDFSLGLSELLRDALERNSQLEQYLQGQLRLSSLNSGEREVLDSVIKGLRNHQIARQLNVSVRTVESRRSKVYTKCGVTNIVELAQFIHQYNRLQQSFGLPARLDGSAVGSGPICS